jgi:hypothetical protein
MTSSIFRRYDKDQLHLALMRAQQARFKSFAGRSISKKVSNKFSILFGAHIDI